MHVNNIIGLDGLMVVSNICTSQSYLHICVLFFIRFPKWCQIFFTHTPSARCDNWWFKTIISKFQLVKLHTIENFHSFGTSINLPDHNGTSFELGQVYWPKQCQFSKNATSAQWICKNMNMHVNFVFPKVGYCSTKWMDSATNC